MCVELAYFCYTTADVTAKFREEKNYRQFSFGFLSVFFLWIGEPYRPMA